MTTQKPSIVWEKADLTPYTGKVQFNVDTDGVMQPIVADTESSVLSLAIANNFVKGTATADAAMDATGCYIKITDATGTLNAPIVKEKWVQAKCTTNGDENYTAIGKADEDAAEVTLTVSAGVDGKAATIEGKANDGNFEGTGAGNVAKIDMVCRPDLNTAAAGGLQAFKFVFVYNYGAE